MTQLGGFQQQPDCWKQLCSVRQSSGESVSWKEARLGGDSVVLRSLLQSWRGSSDPGVAFLAECCGFVGFSVGGYGTRGLW